MSGIVVEMHHDSATTSESPACQCALIHVIFVGLWK